MQAEPLLGKPWKCSKGQGQWWEVFSRPPNLCGLRFFAEHLLLVELGPEPRVAKVLVWFVVVWHLLWVLGAPLVAQAALAWLEPPVLLVGQEARLLEDLLAVMSAFEKVHRTWVPKS